MEEDKNIDDLFRQTIEPFQIDPPEHVWNSLDEKLSARRAPKRDRKILRLWISSIAALLVITAGSFLYFTDYFNSPGTGDVTSPVSKSSQALPPENNSDTKKVSASPSVAVTTTPGNQTGRETGSSTQSRSANPGAGSMEATQPARPVNTQSASNNDSKGKSSSSLATTKKQQNTPASGTLPPDQPAKSSADQGTTIVGNDKKNTATGETMAIASVPAGNKPSTSKDTPAGNNPAEGGSDDGSSLKQAGAATVVTTESGTSTEAEEKGLQEENLAVLPAATAAATETQKSEDKTNVQAAAPVTQDGKTTVPADSVPDYNKDKKSENVDVKMGSRFSIDLYYSPDLSSRKLSDNPDYSGPGSSEGMSIYSNEKSNYSYSTGIRLRGDITEKWTVATGCFFSSFSQTSGLNTIYVVSDSTFRQNTGSSQQGFNQGPEGIQHLVAHTSLGTINLKNHPFPMHGPGECYAPENGDTLNLDIQSTEMIQFISIPLTVRYYLSKNRMAYYAEAGAAINFIYDNSVTSTVNSSYSETNDIVGLKKMNYSMLLSVGVQYSLEHKWNLFAEPNLRYSLTPINENNPVLSYPYFLGLKVGLGYRF